MDKLEIAEGVWQLKVPLRHNPLRYTYSYLLLDDGFLIDTGGGGDEAWSSLEKQVNRAGLRISDIKKIILTHLHPDHVGLVDRIRSASDAEVCAHKIIGISEETMNFNEMKRGIRMLGGSEILSLLNRFDYDFRRRQEPIKIDKFLSDYKRIGSKRSDIRVIWTPGHSPEHICLYDVKEQLLLSGDHVLPTITSNISLRFHENGDPLKDYIYSLDKIKEIRVKLVLPAHEHVFKNLRDRIDELKRHHDFRLKEMKSALLSGEKTVFQVASMISWKSQPWPLMPFWVKNMAAFETLAHLVYMKNRGEITYRIKDDVQLFSL